MKVNVGGFDKWVRILGESFLLGLVGIIPLLNGLTERCGPYSIVGISTCKLADWRLVDRQAVH